MVAARKKQGKSAVDFEEIVTGKLTQKQLQCNSQAMKYTLCNELKLKVGYRYLLD